MKRLAARFMAALCAIALAWPWHLCAQEAKQETSEVAPTTPEVVPEKKKLVLPIRNKRLSQMNEEELRTAGFEWEAQNAYAGSWEAGLLAVVPGLVFHGLGHFYVKDQETGWTLFASGAVGLALLVSGALIYTGTDEGSGVSQSGLALAQTGGGFFALGYLADVVGAFKGSNRELLPVSLQEEGLGARARYRFMVLDGLSLNNLLDVDLELDFGSFYLRPSASVDPLLNYQQYGGVVGLRAVRGDRWNSMALQVRVERASFEEDSGGLSISDGQIQDSVLRAQVEMEVSLDMAQFIPHLRNLVTVSTIGVGFADGAGARAALPGTESRAYFVFHQALMFNVNSGLTVRPYYLFSEAELIRPLDVGLGIFGADVILRSSPDLEITMGVQGAKGFALDVGVTWWWSTP